MQFVKIKCKAQELKLDVGLCWSLGSPSGILGNNVISDPVTCNMDRNLQWLAGMGDQTTVMGINLNRIAKRTIEFWLNHRMTLYYLLTGRTPFQANSIGKLLSQVFESAAPTPISLRPEIPTKLSMLVMRLPTMGTGQSLVRRFVSRAASNHM